MFVGRDNIKRGLYKKLSYNLMSLVTFEQFNNVFLFLDGIRDKEKIIPYKLFDDGIISEFCHDECVFKVWVLSRTSNIEKNFNKSRKFVRMVKDIRAKHADLLAYSISSESVFITMLGVFLLDVGHEIKVPEQMRGVIGNIKNYLSCLLILDMLEDDEDKYWGLVEEIISSDNNVAISKVLHMHNGSDNTE